MTPRPGPPQLQPAVVYGYRAPMPASHQGAFQPGAAPVVYRAPSPGAPALGGYARSTPATVRAPPASSAPVLAPSQMARVVAPQAAAAAAAPALSSSSPAAPVVYRARSPEVPPLGGYARSTAVTIWAPPASPSPAPYQLAQVAARQAAAAAPAPSSSSSAAPSFAALTKEFEQKLFVTETALASPAAAASSAASPPAGEVAVASDKDLAPVSKKHPARPGYGAAGKKVMIRANHFLVNVADNNLFHYDVSINPESKSRATNREVLNELIKLHGKTSLGGKLPAYDGRKSLYTAGSLPFESEEFVVKLIDPEKKDKERAEREYKITIRIAGRTDLYHLQQFLLGRQRHMPQETIQVLDVVLRESPSWNYFFCSYVTVSRSFSTQLCHRGDIGEGLECWRCYYQSLRPTQMGLSLNIDISATSFFKPVTVIQFVEEFLNIRDTSSPLSDRDHVKKMINGGTVDNWTCLSFSRMRPEESFYPRPVVDVRSSNPNNIENALRDVHRRTTELIVKEGRGSLQHLIVILPEVSGSYGKIKRVCETDLGIVSQCCLPRHASRPNKQYLENVALKINVKVCKSSGLVIFLLCRDGVSEGQFSHMLLHEMDAIRKACAFLEEGYLPPVTFVLQKRHHTRLCPEVHGRLDMTDKSGNILPETVLDRQICHPTEFDFYMCSHAGPQVSINPESKSRATNWEVLNELIKLHGKTSLGGKLPAYDGRKSLYTAGSFPFESEEFVVKLINPEKRDKEWFVVKLIDPEKRESPSWNYVTVFGSFFCTQFGHRGDIGEGLECWRGCYQSLCSTQMCLSLNIDISATSFLQPVKVIQFVEEFLNIHDTSRPLLDWDRVKIHLEDQIRRYKITGIAITPMSQLIFPVDENGTRMTVVQYFWDRYNFRGKYASWPCLQSGSDSCPVYLSLEIVEGQRYSNKLSDKQVTNILRATCQRPQRREQSIHEMVLHNKYTEDRFAQEFGIKVCNDLVSVPARVLPPPMLKYHDSGREKTCAPSVGPTLGELFGHVVLNNKKANMEIYSSRLLSWRRSSWRQEVVNSTSSLFGVYGSRCDYLFEHHCRITSGHNQRRKVLVQVNLCDTTVFLVARFTDTVQSIVHHVMQQRKCFVRDSYICFRGRVLAGHQSIRSAGIQEGSTISVNPRIRGGSGRGLSSSLPIREPQPQRVPLDIHIADTKNKVDWFEVVEVPPDLRPAKNGRCTVVLWGEGARRLLRMLFKCVERAHSRGKHFGGRFGIEHLFYRVDLDTLELWAPEMNTLTQETYAADLAAILKIVQRYFQFRDGPTLRFPAYGDHLAQSILAMANAKGASCYLFGARSLIFNHPALMSSSKRIAIITSSMIHGRTRSNDELNKALDKIFIRNGWIGDAAKSTNGNALRERFTHVNYDKQKQTLKTKMYSESASSRLDYSRCLVTHATSYMATEKQVDAALYVLWPDQLPDVQKVLIFEYPPPATSSSASPSSSSSAGTSSGASSGGAGAPPVVNVIYIHELLGTWE